MLLRNAAVDLSTEERDELQSAEMADLDAGFKYRIPAVIFSANGPYAMLKIGYTCSYLIQTHTHEVAIDIVDNMRQHIKEERQA